MADPYHKQGMHKGARPDTFAKAKKLRDNMTQAEVILWEKLKDKKSIGYRFRRQHPLGHYILDFYNHQLKLCIEVDGKYHQNKDQIIKDREREEFINFNGIRVIRFTNEEVINNLSAVLEKIRAYTL